ncbi:MAG TPA: efflux RND transporter periplasmic adaptor subunit, partial [Longimicrobiales bacterium]|nr:efflux RND transporter periplasmic adaptor subunit [Longimicrobiales bacterium]
MMFKITRKQVVLGAAAVAVLAALVWSFLPEPEPVQTAAVRRGPLQVIVEEEARTEVADRYTVSSPVSAWVRRIELEAGDSVVAGQSLASLEPPRTPVLDPSNRTGAEARVRAAESAATQARAEHARVERLAAAGAATRQALEQAAGAADRADAELDAARAALSGAAGAGGLAVEQVLRAPVAGRVLSIPSRSARHVNPAEPLVVIGSTEHLEVHADVLSQDAVRIRPGTRVMLEQWGGDTPLQAVVTRVEPQGFTSVSSLGVEEQRVRVVAAIESPPESWNGGLGAGYRVLARFVVWEGEDVLQVPSAALFRVGEEWAAFVVEAGRAVRRTVKIGQQAGLDTQVLEGLQEGDQVIVHPGNAVEDGVAVEPGLGAGAGE